MAKIINIGGKDLKIAYTLYAAVSYEKMTGTSALDLSKFQNNEIAPVVELGYCMLLANNEEKDIPKLEDMLKSLDTADKMAAFVQAVSEELIAFYTPDKSADAEHEEPAPKNA